MNKSQIVELFVHRARPDERIVLRRTLEQMSAEELSVAYEALLAQESLDASLEATEEELIRIRAEAAAEQALFQLHMQKAREPKRLADEKAQLAKDRKTFEDVARSLQFSLNGANINVIRSTLGSNFTEYSIREAIGSNALQLSPPTQEELTEWYREAVEAHNQRLLSLDIPSLRKLAREAGARGPAAPELDETQRVRQAEQNAGAEYPILPDEYRDEAGVEHVLNAEFIRRCSSQTLRFLMKKYGSEQINNLLRERVVGSMWEV